MTTTVLPRSVSLLQALVRRAEERAVAVAATLRAAERVFQNGIDVQGTPLHPFDENVDDRLVFGRDDVWRQPTKWDMLAPARDTTADLRVARLVRHAWYAKATSKKEERPDVLSLTCDALANPDEPHTAEVARFAVVLSLRAAYHIDSAPATIRKLRACYDDLARRLHDSKGRPRVVRPASTVDDFLVDLLCIDGWLTRRFSDESIEPYYQRFLDAPLGVGALGQEKDPSAREMPKVQGSLPEFGDVINLAYSQPTGIPGLDSVLGGLVGPVQHRSQGIPGASGSQRLMRRAAWDTDVSAAEAFAPLGGLITLLVGPPGSGKTSLSLALCSNLAELGSVARYITTEENQEVLESKAVNMAVSLAAAFRPILDVETTPPDIAWIDGGAFQTLDDIVAVLEHEYATAKGRNDAPAPDKSDQDLHVPFPRVVVIDSLSALLEQQRGHAMRGQRGAIGRVARPGRHHLAELLVQLRDLGVCVFLVGSEGDASDEGLAYIVDNAFSLSLERETTPRHPVRLLTIEKTRLQRSNRGSHVLHLGGRAGCSINPSLHGVLRALKGRPEIALDDSRRAVLVSDARAAQAHQRDMFTRVTTEALTVADRAQVLVYGVGTSGKSRFAMALALEPRVPVSPAQRYREYLASHQHRSAGLTPEEAAEAKRSRVLVLSFLYDEHYYRGVATEVFQQRFRLKPSDARAFTEETVDVLAVHPGFVDPEFVVGSIRKRLRAADLDGKPYSAVVIDGLHNVLMQFPLLQRDPLLWPTLYRLFRTRGLNTVSTFTFFGVSAMGYPFGGGERGAEITPEMLAVRPIAQGGVQVSQPLFFHLLVSSCDYTFALRRHDASGPSHHAPYGIVQLEAAPGIHGRRDAYWDPRALRLMSQLPL